MTAATLLLVVAAAAISVPTSDLRPRLHVDMVVEPGVVLDREDAKSVATAVQRIWARAVNLVVTTPGDRAIAGASDSIRLVVTSRMLRPDDSLGLGWIEFVAGEPRNEITVSAAAVDRMLQAGSWHGRSLSALPHLAARDFRRRALARAIAHEIGHYVRRSTAHDRSGLMRASLSVDDIMDERVVATMPAAGLVAATRTAE